MESFDELKYRGLINDVTNPQLEEELSNGGLIFYIGTDPVGDSLHIGRYSPLLRTKRLEGYGCHLIMLAGGATGFIGDPGASGGCNMLTKEMLEHNYQCLSKQIEALLGFEMVNNLDWTKDISVIDFLRDYGKYFNVNYMINKGTVKRRLDVSTSCAEFSYMILQALDLLYPYEDKECILQPGEQDQQGNITNGLRLVHKKHGVDVECYGSTMSLITKADDTRFGKSELGMVRLDKYETSTHEIYQFFINSEDEKVVDYLEELTFLSREEIDILEGEVKTEPHFREIQKTLVKEAVTFPHGEEEYSEALKIINAPFKGNTEELSAGELQNALEDSEVAEITGELTLTDTLTQVGIASSEWEARERISQGSIQINGDKVKDAEFITSSKSATSKGRILTKKGERDYFVTS